MATKTLRVGKVEVDKLTGTLTGKRFLVILDNIALQDRWAIHTLANLERDGLGHAYNDEGYPFFEFKDSPKSTIRFEIKSETLVVTNFYVTGSKEEEA